MSQIWSQIRRLKTQVPGCLVLFRYGDFYELFDEDAEVAAPILDIVLTSRDMGQGRRAKMAGIPYHALNAYLPKLLEAGHRVAVVEQTGQNPRKLPTGLLAGDERETRTAAGDSRGIIEREVVRVVSAGTVVEPGLLDDSRNNYLAALVVDPGGRAGALAYADVTTGEFAACQVAGPQAIRTLEQELERLRPSEVLLPRADGRARFGEPPALPADSHPTYQDAWRFEADTASEVLLHHYGIASLDGFGLQGLPLAARAAGAVVQYLGETHRSGAAQLGDLRVYSTAGHMALDPATRRNLEILQTGRGGTVKGSLLWVLDQTATPMGSRLLRRWLAGPLVELAPLLQRQEMVADLVADPELRDKVAGGLRGIGDLERLTNRIGQRLAAPRDLLGLRGCLVAVADLSRFGGEGGGARSLLAQLDPCVDESALIAASIADPPASLGEGAIRPGYSAELDDLDASSRHAREWIAGLEAKERAATGIRSLKVGYNKVFGYFLEVSNANREQVPAHYVRKQTLVGAERYITPDLKEYESLVLGAQEARAELESAVFRQVCATIAASRERILRTAELLAQLDVYASLAEVAVRNGYVRPTLDEGPLLRIVGGRHPVVELSRRDVPFVPNDLILASADSASGAAEVAVARPDRGRAASDRGDLLSEEASPSDHIREAPDPLFVGTSVRSQDGGADGSLEASRSSEPDLVAEESDESGDGPDQVLMRQRAEGDDDEAQVVILTGPNMAGKSTYLRQAALIVLMAQIGSFVPAERARIGLVDRIFTRIGAQDDLGAGQSTFLLEMLETANLLTQSTPRSLLILDEVGRGTSTYDGLAIAQSVVEHIHNHPRLRARTLFATHYHELTDLERVLPRVRNFRVDVREEGDGVVFLHRVVRGAADRSYGIHVARLAGIPRGVTRRAEEILKELEAGRRGRGRRREAEPTYQLTLFGEPNPVVEELKTLDVLSLTPLEAITKLFELQQRLRADRQ